MAEFKRKKSSSGAKQMLEQNAYRYHLVGSWVGLSLNPVFAITDFFNFPDQWFTMLCIRILVSSIILTVVLIRDKIDISSSVLISIPLMLISLQNAYVYSFIQAKDLLGQNLNYMALFIGAAMFILWKWNYSLVVLLVSAMATAICVYFNTEVTLNIFFVNGGLLLIVTGIFMLILIHTRYNLIRKNIAIQLALKTSKKLLEKKTEEIRHINENLEQLVQKRTEELKRKNLALERYAFINSHKLRAPVARILGLLKLLGYQKHESETEEILMHMKKSTQEMDTIVGDITKSIEEGVD